MAAIHANESKHGSHGSNDDLRLFGLDIGRLKPKTRFAFLSFGSLFCALAFAALQEKVFLIEGFKYSGFMTVLTTFTYMLCAAIERFALKDTVRKGALKDYVILAVVTFLGMYLTNWSLSYLTYPTRVMFKSSKVIPVMLASVFIVGRRYSFAEYMSALTLVVGITLFTLADKGLPSFNIIGVFLVTLGVIADAVTSNFEEKKFFRALNCSQAEVVFFSSAFGVLFSILTIWTTGELFDAVDHAIVHPEVILYTAVFSAMGYGSVVFVLLLIKTAGATEAEIVKSCRKVLSIVLSFILYAKPVHWMHWVGGAVFIMSIVITIYLAGNKRPKHTYTAVATAEPSKDPEAVEATPQTSL